MKRFVLKLMLVFTVLVAFVCNSALAVITSQSEITYKKNQLRALYSKDLMSFVNKSDLIGYRLSNFTMHNAQYKNEINTLIERLDNVSNQIQVIQNTTEISDSDKQLQITQMYQEANAIVADTNNRTMSYMYAIKDTMPSITYQKYIRTFTKYYNSLNIVDDEIDIHY